MGLGVGPMTASAGQFVNAGFVFSTVCLYELYLDMQ